MNFAGIVTICFLCALCCEVGGWRSFRRGRILRRSLRDPARGTKESSTDPLWFDQKLDHINTQVTTTWKQRYYMNSKYHKTGGPVFLLISGEGEADTSWMDEGVAWIEYAKQFHALCFQLEHRFYGQSKPTKDLSVQSLAYLSSQQALADAASFIKGMNSKHNFPANTKWIVFGGSYAGALAAWMRLKYPDLVHAAVSSSGTVHAVADFKDFLGTVATSLATSGENCVQAIQSATKQMDTMLTSQGLQTIKSKFSLCESINPSNSKDVATLYLTLADYIAEEVQGNSNDLPSWKSSSTNIDKVCQTMTNPSYGSALDRYATVVKKLAKTSSNGGCVSTSYTGTVEYLRGTSWGSSGDGDRQWTYQTCTEFGMFDTSSQTPHVFGDKFPVDYFAQQCSDIFGSRFNKTSLNAGVDRTNKMYGGLSIQVSNVVFIQGSIDPWHAAGITKSISSSSPAIFIKGTSHCGDMYASSSNDLPELIAAHKEIVNVLKKWI